jgi:hypothetical protein
MFLFRGELLCIVLIGFVIFYIRIRVGGHRNDHGGTGTRFWLVVS